MSQSAVLAIDMFLDHRHLKGVRESSIQLYAHELHAWLAWQSQRGAGALSDIALADLRSYFVYLSREHVPHSGNRQRPAEERRGLSPASIRHAWRTLAAFWRFAASEGLLTPEQTGYFSDDRIPRPRVVEDVRPAIDEVTVARLLAVCDMYGAPEKRARDRAIIAMLSESGLRNGELCALRDEDAHLKERLASIVGKGGRHRYVFWTALTDTALVRYVAIRRGDWGGPLFRGVGSRSRGHLKTSAIRDMLEARAEQAGVTLPPGAPCHWFRHGFARQSLRRGMDSLHLQQLLGHASAEMTMRYVREESETLRSIHAQFWDRAESG